MSRRPPGIPNLFAFMEQHRRTLPEEPFSQSARPLPRIPIYNTIFQQDVALYMEHNKVDHPYYATKRIAKDLDELEKDPVAGVTAGPMNDNLYEILAVIEPPESTPYHGGTFFWNIVMNHHYPFKAPEVHCRTRIYHPSIHNDGTTDIDLLRKSKWDSQLTLRDVLVAIVDRLSKCDMDPLKAVIPAIAIMYREDREEFMKTAKLWTRRYAMCSSPDDSTE